MVVHKILRKNVEDALQTLQGKQVSDEHIHRARKELKKARAALRLLRNGISSAQYRTWNRGLRDAARPLSAARDARVLLDTLDTLRSRYGAPGRAVKVTDLTRGLKREHLEIGRKVRKDPDGLAHSRALLRRLLRQIEKGSAQEDWTAIGKGLSRVYGQARKAMRTARSHDPDALHEWRKQTKYLWHELKILEPLWPGVIGELADQAHQLADYLGDDHDLAVLRSRILANADSGGSDADRGALLALIDRCQDQLREKAFLLGERLYEEKPKAFAARFGDYWNQWRREKARHAA
jgi:CHAD domain-containing protein